MSDAILALDPGINGCGAAFFRAGQLHCAGYVRNPSLPTSGRLNRTSAMAHGARRWFCMVDPYSRGEVVSVVAEWPQVYGGGKGKCDPNDLLLLAGVVSAVAALTGAEGHAEYLPREWKGTVDPDAMIERIQCRLSLEEHARVELPPQSLRHNVWDAVGIGLKALGRLERIRAYPR